METMAIKGFLYIVITVAVPLVLRCVFQHFSAKYADSQYAAAMNAVFSAVEYVNQTFVDELKLHGSFDALAQQAALNRAKTAALDIMDKYTREWLDETFDDIDEWLSVQIESAVRKGK